MRFPIFLSLAYAVGASCMHAVACL